MLVKDVMTSPVVTVAPGAHLKDVAEVLVRHRISAELTGPTDPTARRLATLLVRGVSGVVDVRFAEE
jgi:CBS domain-containing protein